MDGIVIVAVVSIITAGLTITIGGIGPALGEAKAVAAALASIAQQPDEAGTITRKPASSSTHAVSLRKPKAPSRLNSIPMRRSVSKPSHSIG